MMASQLLVTRKHAKFPRYNPRMLNAQHHAQIDYLLVGHITRDISSAGESLGGSVTYAALTAKAFGLSPGILTAWAEDLPLGALEGVPIVNIGAEQSTSFENSFNEKGRRQRAIYLAPPLGFHHIPENWRNAAIVHLAPVLGEVSPRMASYFKDSTFGITPQGWLRELKADGSVVNGDWPEAEFVLPQADAAVVSLEDVSANHELIARLAANSSILAVTDGQEGSQIFFNGEIHSLSAPNTTQIDPTGAGDIFAAAFFIRLHFGDNPIIAAQAATRLASQSVEREGLAAAPTQDEVLDLMSEAL